MQTILLLLLLVCSASYADESWFEGSWTWSREKSIELWSQGDNVAKKQLVEVAPKVNETWEVDSGTLKITIDGETHGPISYFIRPIDSSEFELMLDLPSGEVHYNIVRHTDFGFCYRRGGDFTKDAAPALQETCFVPSAE